MPSFDELIKVLAHLCKNLDTDDPVAFEAAIAFGTICVKNQQALEKMMHYLNTGNDTHKKAVVSEVAKTVLICTMLRLLTLPDRLICLPINS